MTHKEAVKRLRKYLNYWMYFVKHWGWKVTLYFCDGYEEMPDEADPTTTAITYCTWPYLEGKVYFNTRLVKDDENWIEELVIHELSHFLVAPMQSDKRNLEISVSMIARTLKGLRDK